MSSQYFIDILSSCVCGHYFEMSLWNETSFCLWFLYGFCMNTLSSYEILFYKTVQATQCRFYCVIIGTKLIWFVSFLFKRNFLCLWFLYGISFKENPVLYKIVHAIWVHMQYFFFPPKELKLGYLWSLVFMTYKKRF